MGMIKFTVEITDDNTERLTKFLLSDLKLNSYAARALMKDVSNLLEIAEMPSFSTNLPISQVKQNLHVTGLSLRRRAPFYTLSVKPEETEPQRQENEAGSESVPTLYP